MPRQSKKKDTPVAGVGQLLLEMAAGISNSVRKPNNLMYEPHSKQLMFHASNKNGRQYIGGNRSGKTTGGINEDIWWLRGQHPYQKVPEPPVIGRITTVDFKNGAEKIIIPNLRQWIPPSLLINGSWEDSYNGAKHILTLENGSELEIMSYDQELDKFAGVPRHFTHFDEEPPEDIFNECKARLVDYGGHWWMTMTPVEGMTWTFDKIYEPSTAGNVNPLIDIIEVNITDNPHLKPEAIIDFLGGFSDDADAVSIRGTGKYVAIGGLVFKHYDPEKHVISQVVPPREWTHYISLDAGYNNPTAVLWHAVGPLGQVVTYDEHYKSEMTVSQHAAVIKNKERYYQDNYGIVPFLRIADPAIKQRQQTTGLSIQIEYAQHGLNFATGYKRSVDAGLDKMNDYLRLSKWFITENCPNLQKEMRTYKRASYATSKLKAKNNKKEEPQKKNDHACDSSRYFFSYMPELDIEIEQKKPGLTKQQVATMMMPGSTYDPRYPVRVDTNLGKQQNHFVVDEYIGEY
jgi:phage terminase large subunit-like protein